MEQHESAVFEDSWHSCVYWLLYKGWLPEMAELFAILHISDGFKSEPRVHLSILAKWQISPQAYTTILDRNSWIPPEIYPCERAKSGRNVQKCAKMCTPKCSGTCPAVPCCACPCYAMPCCAVPCRAVPLLPSRLQWWWCTQVAPCVHTHIYVCTHVYTVYTVYCVAPSTHIYVWVHSEPRGKVPPTRA